MLKFTFLFFFLGSSLYGLPESKTLEAFGDSLTAGFLSATDVTKTSLTEVGKIQSDFAMYGLTQDPQYLRPYLRSDLAWPDKLASLLSLQGEPTRTQNFAVPGAKIKDLLSQVQKISQKNKRLAFFFIGHNDFCKNTLGPEELSNSLIQHYRVALKYWDQNHDQSVAYLIPIGEIYRVYESLHDYVWSEEENSRHTCVDSWGKYFPYCLSHLKHFNDGSLRAFLQPRIQSTNEKLQLLTEQMNTRSRTNKFVFLRDATRFSYQPKNFATDCYHLSEAGQRNIAEQLFSRISKE